MTRIATGLAGVSPHRIRRFCSAWSASADRFRVLLLGPFAGVWVDRWNRHRVLVVTQVLSMVQSFCAGRAGAKRIASRLRDIILLSLFQGAINAFDMPARQAFVIQMVEDREDLRNAIALNSSMVNAARLIGPSIAGVVIALWGEGYCFLIDGISYLAVIASLLDAMTGMVRPQRDSRRRVCRICRRLALRGRLGAHPLDPDAAGAGVSLVGMPYTVLMPMFAARVLHGGPHTLGFLMAAAGVGALISAGWLAARKSVLGLGRVIPAMSALFGGALIAFSLSRWLWLSLLLMVCHRLWHDAADGGQQHHPANHCGRRQTRPGDELLLHGVHGHDALRQPVRRHRGGADWSSIYAGDRRHLLCGRSAVVRQQAAPDSRPHSPDIFAPGNPAGDRRRPAGRGITSAAGTVKGENWIEKG